MRFPVPNLSFAALILLGTLAGCAAPQYVTNLSLTPPADTAGRTCAQGCETRKTACQADCQTRYQACAKRLEPQVEARYVEALHRRYFIHSVTRLRSIQMKYNQLLLAVDTDKGPAEFYMRWAQDRAVELLRGDQGRKMGLLTRDAVVTLFSAVVVAGGEPVAYLPTHVGSSRGTYEGSARDIYAASGKSH